jgi:membrane protease YdiL (CAAX protease family)
MTLPQLLLVAARVVGAMLAWFGVLIILAGTLTVLGPQVFGDAATSLFGLVALGIAFAGALASVLVLWRAVDKRPIAAIGFGRREVLKQCLRGAAIATVLMCTIVLVSYSPGVGTWTINPDPVRAVLALVLGLVGFAIQGSSEEVLFRGYILENVRERWGAQWGIAASAGGFVVIHSTNPEFDVLPLVNLLLFGVVAGFYKLYVDRGQLWGVCAIHAVWNWWQQVVFGLPNSGNVPPPENTLFSVRPDQNLPGVVSGGGFGPEGTLAATLVLIALLVFALRRRQPMLTGQAPTSV